MLVAICKHMEITYAPEIAEICATSKYLYLRAFVRVQIIVMVRPVLIYLQNTR